MNFFFVFFNTTRYTYIRGILFCIFYISSVNRSHTNSDFEFNFIILEAVFKKKKKKKKKKNKVVEVRTLV
ncbi:hypothetical protein PGB90_007337 [Kerria lacca]